MKVNNKFKISQILYLEFIKPIVDYICILNCNEWIYEIIFPILVSVCCVSQCAHKNKTIVVLDKLSDMLLSVISILIGITVLLITLLLTCSNNNIDKLKAKETTKKLNGNNLNLFQILHIQFTSSLFAEVFLLIVIFAYLYFFKVVTLNNIIISSGFLLVYVYIILNILLSIVRGITNIYFALFNSK